MYKLSFFFWHVLKYLMYLNRLVPIHKGLSKVIGSYRYYKFFSLVERKCLKKDNLKKSFKVGEIHLMFDGRLLQAGLADNLRAATSVYHLCKDLDKGFKIQFFYPFLLADYLVPNNYDWLTLEDKSKNEYCKCIDIACFSYRDIFADLNDKLQKKYLQESLNTNSDAAIKLYTNTFCYDDSFYCDYHELFKPSPLLQSEIDKHLSNIGSAFVSASFRFSNLLGDLDDTFGVKLPEEKILDLIDKCINAIIEIKNSNPSYRVFVTTDSITFSKVLQNKLDYVYMIPGSIGHVGHNGKKDVVIKTFLDLLVISYAEKVYMVRTVEMYKSGFAYRAAQMGNKQFIEKVIK